MKYDSLTATLSPGGSAILKSSTINKNIGFGQVSASNLPQRKAAIHYK